MPQSHNREMVELGSTPTLTPLLCALLLLFSAPGKSRLSRPLDWQANLLASPYKWELIPSQGSSFNSSFKSLLSPKVDPPLSP